MSRNITLVLLGGAVLCSCCCVLRPPWRDEPEDGTTASTSRTGGSSYSPYRRTVWWPVFFRGSSYRGGYSSPPRSGTSPGKGSSATSGGFGGTGHSVSGAS
jgi:hypothetical protein